LEEGGEGERKEVVRVIEGMNMIKVHYMHILYAYMEMSE
jgi:hypothetical protein